MISGWNRRQVTVGLLASLPMARLVPQAQADAPKSGEIRFLDMAGVEVVLSGPAQRIIDTFSPLALTIAVHGSPARIVGMHPNMRWMLERSFISRMYPQMLSVPTDVVSGRSSYAPSVETIAALDPDVVLHWGDYGMESVEPLRNAGIPVATFASLPEGPEEMIRAFATMLGQMIGDTSRVTDIVTLGAGVRADLDETLAGLTDAERARALIVTPTGDGLAASGGDADGSFSYYIYRAGGLNCAESLPAFSGVSVEQIAAWDPDAIFLFNSAGATPAWIHDDPILAATAAGRDRRVYILPIGAHSWGSLGPEDPLMHVWMAELLYPDRMDRSLRRRMRAAYRTLYGHDFSEDELDAVLLMDLNGQSAHYARFARE